MNLTLSTPWCPTTVALTSGGMTVVVCGTKYCVRKVIVVPGGNASWIGVSSSSAIIGAGSNAGSVCGKNVKFLPSGLTRGSSGIVSWTLRGRHSSSSVYGLRVSKLIKV